MQTFSLSNGLLSAYAYKLVKTRASEQLLQIDINVRSASDEIKLLVSVARFNKTGITTSMCGSISLGGNSAKAVLRAMHAFFET
jgi:hypothetical protein